jgi:hypothetical protein
MALMRRKRIVIERVDLGLILGIVVELVFLQLYLLLKGCEMAIH